MATATSAIQTFIDATKKTLASIATQITGLATRLTKSEGRLTTAEGQIKMLIAQTSSGAAAAPPTPFVYIVSSAYGSLPSPGNRVSSSDGANMPIITASAGNSAIVTANAAHHFRFVGIQFQPPSGSVLQIGVVRLGNTDTSTATLPHHIIFDRCYLHGDATNGGRRGISMDGNYIGVVDSYLSNFWEAGADSQALWAYNGEGPFKIWNNYLEAASENIMFGGTDPAITNLVPSDISIQRNLFFKPLSWVGAGKQVKNLFEIKSAARVLLQGNVFQNVWQDSQAGYSILITPRNAGNTAPWSTAEDLTIRYNKFVNVGNGIDISGADNFFLTLVTRRLLIESNVLGITNINSEDHRVFLLTNPGTGGAAAGPNDLTIKHNTGLILTTGGASAFSAMDGAKATGFDFRDNMLSMGSYGFIGNGTGEGTSALIAFYTGYTFTKNAIIGSTGTYPAGNFFPTNNAAVGFVDYAGGDYTLTSGSTYHNAASDGTDVGADISTLSTRILHSSDGQWGSEPALETAYSYTTAETPRTFVDTTYHPQSGATITVNSGGNLQTALNNANLGDTIVLQAGATFTGPFTLPAK